MRLGAVQRDTENGVTGQRVCGANDVAERQGPAILSVVLTVNGGVGYTHARFLQHIDLLNQNLSGTSLPNAPEFTYNLAADYEFQKPIGLLTPFVRVELNGTSSFDRAAGAATSVGDYDLVNLRGGVRGESFDFTLFVENLFDERYVVEPFTSALGTGLGVPGEPRKFGFVASMRF